MKNMGMGKTFLVIATVLGLLAGCASTPKPVSEPMVEKAPSQAVPQALAAAKAAMAQAASLGWSWRDTGSFLKQAQEAADKGDDATAIKLADKARMQAEEAVNQYYLEKAKVMMVEMQGYAGLSADQDSRLKAAAAALSMAQGKKAYDLLSGLAEELRAANIQYAVVRGDSLWKISGKSDIYNNPYQWPLIYKANRSQIKDADLIYPGQNFSIDRNPSASEVSAAVNHAKTRGAWSLGEVEESDRAYAGGLRLR